MFALQACFEKLENEMKEVNTNQEALKRNFLELTELKHILRKTQNFFDEVIVSWPTLLVFLLYQQRTYNKDCSLPMVPRVMLCHKLPYWILLGGHLEYFKKMSTAYHTI